MYKEVEIVGEAFLWTSDSQKSGLVPADGCVDIIWQSDQAFISGPSTKVIRTTKITGLATGLRIPRGIASSLLPINALDLQNLTVPIDDVFDNYFKNLIKISGQQGQTGVIGFWKDILSSVEEQKIEFAVMVRKLAYAQIASTSAADYLGLSTRHFRRLVGKYFGYTYQNLRNQYRFDAASSMLQRQTVPLTVVAEKCGYADQSHMNRDVRSRAGQTITSLQNGNSLSN